MYIFSSVVKAKSRSETSEERVGEELFEHRQFFRELPQRLHLRVLISRLDRAKPPRHLYTKFTGYQDRSDVFQMGCMFVHLLEHRHEHLVSSRLHSISRVEWLLRVDAIEVVVADGRLADDHLIALENRNEAEGMPLHEPVWFVFEVDVHNFVSEIHKCC